MNTVQFPNKVEIESQAASWIAIIDRGLTDAEYDEFDAWLNASPVHGEMLVKCASMWDLLEVLSPIAKLMPMDVEAAIASFSEKSSPENDSSTLLSSNDSKAQWFKNMGIAASLVMILGGGLTLGLPLMSSNYETKPQTQIVQNYSSDETGSAVVYKTVIGEISKASLPDGSELQLNTNTELRVSFDENQRTIELLHGEAFFEVAKDPSKPFVVIVGDDSVTAVGTAFNVDASEQGSTEVLVTEGKVRVKNELNEQPVYLESGQKALVVNNAYKVSDDSDLDSQLAWRDRELVFKGESLVTVIKEINRYTPLTLILVDPEIASIPVGGFFKTGDLNQLLQVFEYNLGISHRQQGDEILLSKISK